MKGRIYLSIRFGFCHVEASFGLVVEGMSLHVDGYARVSDSNDSVDGKLGVSLNVDDGNAEVDA